MFIDSFTAEFQRVLQAASFTRDISLRRIMLEGDALQIVNSLKFDSSQSHISCLLLWDPKLVLNHFDYWNIADVRRNVNMAAHVLAKYALGSEEDEIRLDDSHLCILHFI